MQYSVAQDGGAKTTEEHKVLPQMITAEDVLFSIYKCVCARACVC